MPMNRMGTAGGSVYWALMGMEIAVLAAAADLLLLMNSGMSGGVGVKASTGAGDGAGTGVGAVAGTGVGAVADFPLLEAGSSMVVVFLLTCLCRRFHLRRIYRVILQAAAFFAAMYFVTGAYAGLPFFQSTGIQGRLAVLGELEGFFQWFHFCLIAFITGLFWFRGMRTAGPAAGRDSAQGRNIELDRGGVDRSREAAVRVFDRGFGVLLAIAFIRITASLPDTDFSSQLLLYLLFGLLTLIIAGNRAGDGEVIKRRSPIGVFVVFAGLLLFLASLFYAAYPLLSRSADELYLTLQQGIEAAEPWLVRIVRFIFGLRRPGPSTEGTAPAGSGGPAAVEELAPPGFLAELFEFVFTWGLVSILCAALLFLCGWAVVRLFRYLLARPEDYSSRAGGFSLRELIVRILARITFLFGRTADFLPAFDRQRKRSPSAACFKTVLRWGRRSGLSRRCSETPAEYCRRLAAIFPEMEEEFRLILGAAEKAFYCETEYTIPVSELRRACRRLKSLALYPRRLRHRITSQS